MLRTRSLLAIHIALLLAACTATASPPPARPSPLAFACSQPAHSPLPEWARAGFTPPDQPVDHFMGEAGNIVAVPFDWPLSQQQPSGRSNKILWIAMTREAGPLVIDAELEDGTQARREVADGPGPSIIDLPRAGCWRFDLSWPGGEDRLHLRYEPPR